MKHDIGILLNEEDLLEELRLKDCPNIADVHTAILETNGELSVVLKSNKRAVTPEDLKINPKQENVPLVLISDGKIRFNHLKDLNKDIKWLNQKLADRNKKNTADVFLFSVDSDGIITMQIRDGAKN